MNAMIRLATPADADVIAAIYGPYCEQTAVSFEIIAPSTEDMRERIKAITEQFPWLVLEDDGRILGYAYASSHRERLAYGWSVDSTVYIEAGHHRQGIGRALYTMLFRLLRLQGFFKVFAGIALPNPASVGLHVSVGFHLVGVYRGVGYKNGVWHDVSWYQLALQPEQPYPASPQPITALSVPQWQEAITQALPCYRPRPPAGRPVK